MTTEAQSNTETEYRNPYDDPLYLSSSDFPGMQLVSTVFNGKNYLPWSRGIILALGSKNKQCFLDGTVVKPSANSPKLQQWTRCDNMVRCWLLNSIVSGIKEGFFSAKSAKLLWTEIQERYGQSNGPLLFQLKKELRNVTQENQNVAEYFTSLKRYWDDIEDLEEIPDCSCGVMAGCTCNILKKILEAASREKVLTFLMGLSDCYENLRTNILSMEPMPGINKVYSMVQQIESQKLITNVLNSSQESSALVANRQGDVGNNWNNWRKDAREFKKPRMDDRFCHHCNKRGHTKDRCFKLHPELLQQMQKSRLNPSGHRFANQAQMQPEYLPDTPMDHPVVSEYQGKFDPALVTALYQEMMKMASSSSSQNVMHNTHDAAVNFAGPCD